MSWVRNDDFFSSPAASTPQRDQVFVTERQDVQTPGTRNATYAGMPQTGFPIFPHSECGRVPRERFHQELAPDALSLDLQVSIHADIRRLFHALTDPEYLEAWLLLPGGRPGCSTLAERRDREYLIEHFCEGRQSILISGRYLVLRRRHVTFSWKVEGDFAVPDTEVEIRLRGDFERTTLILKHTGFKSRHDSAWHRALWNGSVARLMSLYGLQSPAVEVASRAGDLEMPRDSRAGRDFSRSGYERAS
jgi:uncharacterized protein YndB with AHSA1/START domain